MLDDLLDGGAFAARWDWRLAIGIGICLPLVMATWSLHSKLLSQLAAVRRTALQQQLPIGYRFLEAWFHSRLTPLDLRSRLRKRFRPLLMLYD